MYVLKPRELACSGSCFRFPCWTTQRAAPPENSEANHVPDSEKIELVCQLIVFT